MIKRFFRRHPDLDGLTLTMTTVCTVFLILLLLKGLGLAWVH